MKPLAIALLAAAALLLAGSAPAGAEDEGWSYQLAHELMSPYCPGRALAECPSPQAEELRAWIVAQEKAGRARADVVGQLYERFGEQLRQAPRAEGWGLLAYLVPAGVTLAGGLVVAAFFVHVRRRGEALPSADEEKDDVAPPVVDPELMRQVDEELAASEEVERER